MEKFKQNEKWKNRENERMKNSGANIWLKKSKLLLITGGFAATLAFGSCKSETILKGEPEQKTCVFKIHSETKKVVLHQNQYADVGGLRFRLEDVEQHRGIQFAIVSVLDPCTNKILKKDKHDVGPIMELRIGGHKVEIKTIKVISAPEPAGKTWEAEIKVI